MFEMMGQVDISKWCQNGFSTPPAVEAALFIHALQSMHENTFLQHLRVIVSSTWSPLNYLSPHVCERKSFSRQQHSLNITKQSSASNRGGTSYTGNTRKNT